MLQAISIQLAENPDTIQKQTVTIETESAIACRTPLSPVTDPLSLS